MSKIFVFKKSIPYTNNYNNVIHFANENERDTWINNNLVDEGEDYKQLLDNQPEIYNLETGILNQNIEIAYPYKDIRHFNYCVIKDNRGDLSFYFILAIDNLGNNNKVSLSLSKDIFMNYLGFLDKLKNFKLVAGHSPLENYYDREFNDLYFKDKDFREIKKNNEGGISLFDNTPFLYVLTKAKEGGGITKEKGGRSYLEAFKVYVAPMKDVPISDASQPVIFNVDYQLDTDELDSIEIPFNQEINDADIYRFDYGINSPGKDREHVFYEISGGLLPNMSETKLIFIGGNNDTSKNNADNLNNGNFNNTHLLFNDNGIIFPIKITNIDNLNYLFETPSGSDLYNLYNDTWYYLSADVPNNSNAWGDGSDAPFDTHIILKQLVDLNGTSNWNAISLMNYINETTDDTIISAKVSNFNPLIINKQDTNIAFSDIVNITKDNEIYRLNYVNYDNNINNYKIYFQELEEESKLRGLLLHKLLIENTLEIDINNLFFKKESRLIDGIEIKFDVLEFGHYASITPEWEERIKFIKDDILDISSDANSWKNDKEFTIGQNVWNTYKASDPITSRLGLRVVGGFGSIFGTSIKGSLFKDFRQPVKGFSSEELNFGDWYNIFKKPKNGKPFDKLTESSQINRQKEYLDEWLKPNKTKLNKRLVSKSVALGVGQEIGTILGRTNTRNMLETTSGSGDILGDLIFNYSNNFILVNMEPIGLKYVSLLREIRRNGLEYDYDLLINDINVIKRKNFNYIRVNNIFENINLQQYQLSFEEIEMFIELFNNGLRIWWNPENFLNFEVLND